MQYGLHKLYRLFGKPWNAATEGSEHLHQDMKRYFLHLTCHSNKKTGDCLQVLRLMLVKQSLLRKYAHLLPHSQYAAMRANMVLSKDAADKGKKRAARTQVPRASKCTARSGSER